MNLNDLVQDVAWDAVDAEVDFWVEEKARLERIEWMKRNGY